MKHILTLLLAACSLAASAQSLTHHVYAASDDEVPNPERGFFVQKGVGYSSTIGINVVSENEFRSYRNQTAGTVRLVQFKVCLKKFKNADIDAESLANLQTNFDNMRAAGLKCVLRFLYEDEQSNPPQDATPEQTWRHIAQLKPIVQQNADVIAVYEAGLIGNCGEWHSTTNWQTTATQDYWALRRQLVEHLLDMLPADRYLLLRTANYKIRTLGLTLDDYLTAATAHTGTPQSRVGGHCDSFLWNATDGGSFDGTAENQQRQQTFWKEDSKWTPMGGECGASGTALGTDTAYAAQRLAEFHYTYLNNNHSRLILDVWDSTGFIKTARRKLGYRIELRSADITSEPRTGEPLTVRLKLRNVGYAAPMNPRPVQLVLRNDDGTEFLRTTFDTDWRRWLPGEEQTLEATTTLPADLPSDFYSVSIELPDASPTLSSRPEYSVQLANDGTWDATTGSNVLATIYVANADEPEADCTAQYVSEVKPWTEKAGSPFYLRKDRLAGFDLDALATYCNTTNYRALKRLVNHLDQNLVFPDGYYRLKSQTYYLTFDGRNDGTKGKVFGSVGTTAAAAASDLGTIVRLTPQGGALFTLQSQGHYMVNQHSGPVGSSNISNIIKGQTAPHNLTWVINEPGRALVYIQPGTPADLSKKGNYYLLNDGTSWCGNRADAVWTVEAVEGKDIALALHDIGTESYATLCAPFPVSFTDGTTAYALSEVRDTGREAHAAILEEISGTVPAGTPMLLIHPDAALTTKAVIGSDNAQMATVGTNNLAGSYLPLDWTQHADDLALGTFNNLAGFYRWNGSQLAANRAYLPAAAVPGVRQVVFDFGQTTSLSAPTATTTPEATYDLQGRRIARSPQQSPALPRGLYITNGKKLLVR